MKIHHFRNATMVVETSTQVILVDPMLGPKGSMPTFTLFRYKARKNPIVPMPAGCEPILEKVTHCVITHQHPDHIDKAGEQFLKERNIPVTCSAKDEKHFRKRGLNVVQTLEYWKEETFLGGTIMGIPARHGYGFIAGPMGNVMGFCIALPDTPSLYISADTVYTEDVDKALKTFKPEVAVVAAGTARLDFGKPLLMTVDDVVRFVKQAPGKVLANHLEAVNHCPTTRKGLRERLTSEGISEKVSIPEDGEVVEFSH
ncbi:MBL fold metallo-hydrolase [Algivirga pacifica]|uniref:MBL fold metallo-hydrolase n=1 Tax=Algivirga pacifica TaxID=1162670 RepID=A0ABP9CX29_9BACT